MHDTAVAVGEAFFKVYVGAFDRAGARILEVGARDVSGGLRRFAPSGTEYVGLDYIAGPGVDVAIEIDAPLPFEAGHFDAVVSSSAFEHDMMFWVTFREMARVLRPGGVLYINAPSAGCYHAYPVDCWRFYPDAALALERWAQREGFPVNLLESFILENQSEHWNDNVMVFSRVGARAPERRLYHLLERHILEQRW